MSAPWRRIRRENLALLAATAALFAALALLRAQLVVDLGVSATEALELGLGFGLVLDAALAAALAALVVALRGRSSIAAWVSWVLVSTALWALAGGNVLYVSYFGTRLDLWVIVGHLRDLPTIRRSVVHLLTHGLVLGSVLMVGALVTAVVLSWGRARREVREAALGPRGDGWMAATILAATAAVVGLDLELANRRLAASSVLAESVLITLLTRRPPEALVDPTDPRAPGRVLSQLRDWDSRHLTAPVPALRAGPDDDRGLVRELAPDPASTRALRRRMGLPPDGPIHIVLLLLESTRAFELEHPDLGPLVFPRVREVLARHGVRFPVAYSSPVTVAETVQGMLATQCSMLPNSGGAPVYVAREDLRVRCLQEIAGEHGYRTAFVSGGPKGFHNKAGFDARHGTQEFYDQEYFASFPFEDRFSDCGYPDRPMLRQSVRLLEQLAQGGRPVLATMLTLSTHHPVTEIPQGPIPPELEPLLKPGRYRGYISRLRYLDESLGSFFADLFASPIADRTLVVMVGDHGVRYRPHVPTSPSQRVELVARIPLAFVTRDMPAGQVVDTPVHQVDVAPSIAAIAGFAGTVSWVGQSVWSGRGTPWILGDIDELHYRAGDTACYTHLGERRPRCYSLDGSVDPLFVSQLPARANDPRVHSFIEAVTSAERQALVLDRVMPGAPEGAGLVVAAGVEPQHPVGLDAGGELRLVGLDLDRSTVARGETFTVTWYVEALRDAPADEKLLVRLATRFADPSFVMELDHHPADGVLPLRQLRRGQVVKDVQRVTLETDFPLGEAWLTWALGRGQPPVTVARLDVTSPAHRHVDGPVGEPAVVGCSDGQREGYADAARWPGIAGCVASWEGAVSLRALATGASCGDDSLACPTPADACAVGWHVCGVEGDVADLRRHVDGVGCNEAAGPGRFVAALSHCARRNVCNLKLTEGGELPCLEAGYCAEPVCCGDDCAAGECRDTVWHGATRIAKGTDQGCGAATSDRNAGILCCQDVEDTP